YRHFKIDEMPPIEWASGPAPIEIKYTSPEPQLSLEWKKSFPQTQAWRLRFAAKGAMDAQTPWQTVRVPHFETVVPSAGVYVVELEALDDQQRTIARSALKEIKVSEAPRLPAPEFAENLPSIIKSDARGNVRVNWTA